MNKNILYLFLLFIFFSCKKDDKLNLAKVKTIDSRVINSNQAECRGVITDLGSARIYEKGFLWSNDSLQNTTTRKFEVVNTERDTFSTTLTRLLPETKYFVKAFASNELGTFYGNTISFITDSNIKGSYIDERDNKEYKYVYIDNVAWMSENLNYKIDGSSYYNNDSASYSKEYGRLYSFESALAACPAGWELPSDDDWMKLEAATGMRTEEIISSNIRGWEAGQLLVDGIQGLNITLSGYKWQEKWFYIENESGYWTSTQENSGAYCRGFQMGMDGIKRFVAGNDMQYSVRCIRK